MDWSKRDWIFCLILAVVTLLAYQPAWHGGLLWDDDFNVATPQLRSLDGLRRIWFVPRTTLQYYPLLYSSSWLQERFWSDSPTGYHLVNLLLHIGCVVLALKILRFLRIPGAELATIVFALHPVNVETVAWITERKNTLSGVFALAATLSYLKFDENRSRREKDGPQGRGYRRRKLPKNCASAAANKPSLVQARRSLKHAKMFSRAAWKHGSAAAASPR